MAEKYLFSMPDSMEPFLAATAVVQAFCYDEKEKKNKDCEIDLICFNPTLQVFSPVFSVKHNFVKRVASIQRGSYDLVVDFDEKAAYKVARRTSKHIVQMFGIAIGADPINGYPGALGDFSKMEKGEGKFDVLIWGLSDDLGSKFCAEVLTGMKKSFTFIHEGLAKHEEDNAHYVCSAVREHKAIVGVRGSATYLACSYGKPVVELYNTEYYKGWLSKWANPKYQMIYGDNPHVETITKALEHVWAVSDCAESTGHNSSTATAQ